MAILSLPMLIIALYLLIFVAIGGYEAYRGISRTPSDYFLAGRTLGPVILLLTVFASAISGFAYFGGPGFAYVSGTGFLALGFASVASALTMYLIGMKVYLWGREFDYVSPPELFADRVDSPVLGVLLLIIMVVYLIPYIAIQPIAGGIIFEIVSDGSISEIQGVFITIGIMTAYVLVAGMRGVALTDSIQGFLMYVFIFVVLVLLVAAETTGITEFGTLMAENPDIFTAPGPINVWTPEMVFSWIVLLSATNPIVPYLMVRYMSANSPRTVKSTAYLYGLIVLIFYIPIALFGALGSIAYPELEATDEILVVAILDVLPVTAAAVILGGALSALISTADSQLLVISQMITRDGYKEYINQDASERRETYVGRVSIVVLAFLGGVMAIFRPTFLFDIGDAIFTGMAAMFPAILAMCYWKATTKSGAIASIVVGQILALGQIFAVIPDLSGPFHVIIPTMIGATLALVVVSFVTESPPEHVINKFYS